MQLDCFASDRVYNFDAQAHDNYLKRLESEPEFPNTVHLVFKDDFVKDLSAETIGHLFGDYGDFQICKDSYNSCYFEAIYFNTQKVPDRSCKTFMALVLQNEALKVMSASMHNQAKKFVAHNM